MSIIQNVTKTINYGRKNGYEEAFFAAWERVTVKYHADYDYQEPSQEELDWQKGCTCPFKVSIVVPAFETKAGYMKELVECCLSQSYSDWELIIADGSDSDVVSVILGQYQDTRIQYHKLENNGGISDNTNQALRHATGEYVGLLDHDDLLTRDAIYQMVYHICQAKEKGCDPVMAYSDEDKCDEHGTHFYDPHFKLDFNLDLILTNNYICHFLMVKTELIQKLQIRKQYDGAQDFDLVLRIVSALMQKERENVTQKIETMVVHVPLVLYHWRCHQGSTADNPQSKMYAYESGRKALADFTRRMGWKADIRHNKHLGFYRISYRNPVLQHRDDLAAVGGFVLRNGKVVSGKYRGTPVVYAGYMNRMDLYQNTNLLDIRNLSLQKEYYELYEKITGHAYVDTFAGQKESELPVWIQKLTEDELMKISHKLSKQLREKGKRLLLDPESVRKLPWKRKR